MALGRKPTAGLGPEPIADAEQFIVKLVMCRVWFTSLATHFEFWRDRPPDRLPQFSTINKGARNSYCTNSIQLVRVKNHPSFQAEWSIILLDGAETVHLNTVHHRIHPFGRVAQFEQDFPRPFCPTDMVTGTVRVVGRHIMQQGGCPYNSHISPFRPSYAISQRDDPQNMIKPMSRSASRRIMFFRLLN